MPYGSHIVNSYIATWIFNRQNSREGTAIHIAYSYNKTIQNSSIIQLLTNREDNDIAKPVQYNIIHCMRSNIVYTTSVHGVSNLCYSLGWW